ncbi:hypothetical protein GIB67_030957 [Kingdonia uniflora]|uniref:Uncharacterized protein n=1 Tax=Kingdonia uniflora TaxID=39325 RepID=A0A7J7L3M5_9MAGN|nr:hypothetical protein GIB67_030957 [Kingdonia uniflora]
MRSGWENKIRIIKSDDLIFSPSIRLAYIRLTLIHSSNRNPIEIPLLILIKINVCKIKHKILN